jgi:hypothetical protein
MRFIGCLGHGGLIRNPTALIRREKLAVQNRERITSPVTTESFGVRWQAERDTALDLPITCLKFELKRRRRFALPAHSKNLSAKDLGKEQLR